MCRLQRVRPFNKPAVDVMRLEINTAEAAYIAACLGPFSSNLVSGEERDVYAKLVSALDDTEGERLQRQMARNLRTKYTVTPQ